MIYENNFVQIEIEKGEIPWLKIFTKDKNKELSSCSKETKKEIFDVLDIIEIEMLSYYECEKINIASFGNYMPQVHFHIMARFKDDSHYPEPMWGKKQREAKLHLPSFEDFCIRVVSLLENR